MKLNIDSLQNKEKTNLDFDLSENIQNLVFSGVEYSLVSPLHLNGKISKVGKNFLLSADVDFVILTNCGRCLVEVEYPIEYKIDAYLMREDFNEGDYEDFDVFEIDEYIVDLLKIIESTLSYNMPQKTLCKEECKGICSGCGVDLNTEICKCEDSIDNYDIDPRFAKLKELLK